MHDLLASPIAVEATWAYARSAMPDAPVVRRRPRRRWLRRRGA